MAEVTEHYENVLSDIYSWMSGGFDQGIERNTVFFEKRRIYPSGSGVAVDLGAGCGFQSIPLAKNGYSVTAIDSSSKLLRELSEKSGEYSSRITVIQDDLLKFNEHISGEVELATCMVDTITHLKSRDDVESLFANVFNSLEQNGKFILTYRDLSAELSDVDRFIPVASDDKTIFLCFLEYEPEAVKVHDIVYIKEGKDWNLKKSFYRKLRLPKEWVDRQLSKSGFSRVESSIENGFVTIIAVK